MSLTPSPDALKSQVEVPPRAWTFDLPLVSRARELHSYRELLYALVVKELKVRYKGSALGFLWSLVNPLLMMLVFTFVFSFVFRAGVKDFPLFFLAGFLAWNFFSVSVVRSTSSIIENANLIKKVYFPREIIPLSIVFANLINFGLELLVLFVFLLVKGYIFLPYLPLLVYAIAIQVVMISGFSLAVAAATVYFRDLQQLMGILLMAWFYGTPVLYPLEMVPDWAEPFVKIVNPMTSVILLFREALYNLNYPSLRVLVYPLVVAGVVLLAGSALFARLSPSFAKEV